MSRFGSWFGHAGPASRRVVAMATAASLLGAGCGAIETSTPSPAASGTPAVSASASPIVPASPSAVPSASGSGPATSSVPEQACASVDLRASAGPWGGAAGSRGADVAVENGGSAACRLPAGPVVAIVDRTGRQLLESRPVRVGQGPEIRPGETVTFSVLFGNWCDLSVALPLSFRLGAAGGPVAIADLAVASADALPPCNGEGQPASLSTTGWEPG